MTTAELQFIFSLFSFVGVVGILFYLILAKAKQDEMKIQIAYLQKELNSLKSSSEDDLITITEESTETNVESMREKIIGLYEEGVDVALIEEAVNVPKAKIEMVLKFHNINKSDNWRESVNNTL